MKFRTRLTIAFAVLSLLIIGAGLLHTLISTTRHDRQVALLNLRTFSLQAVRGIDLLVQQAGRDTIVVSRSAFLNEPGRSTAAINRRLHDFSEGSAPIDRLTCLDTRGIIIADSEGMQLGERQFAEAWKLGMSGTAGALIQDNQHPAPGLLLYAPVRHDLFAPPRGVVVAYLPVQHILRLINTLHSDELGAIQPAITLQDRTGKRLAASGPPELLQRLDKPPAELPGPQEPQQVLADSSMLQVLTLDDELSRIGKNSWYLQIATDTGQVMAGLRTWLQMQLAVSLGLFTIGCSVIYLLAGHLSRPLELITAAVRRRGDGDLAALAQLPERRDEFALLQQSLQEMSLHLEQNTERLAASEEQFHALFDALAEGAALHRVLYDHEGTAIDYRLDEVNRSFEQILGLKREQVLGRTATEVYRTEAAPYLAEFSQVVATGNACSFETHYEPLHQYFSISVCRIGPERFATVFSDITAQKQHAETLRTAMTQLQQANEAKSRFLAVMSHEIRTPLNGITGMVQLLRDMEMPPLQREFLDNIDSSADSLLNVINDILDFSKIEAGKLELEIIPFEPQKLLHDTLRTMRLRAQAKGQQLTLRTAEPLPPVLLGDPHRLRQVLTNLVGNAIKFTVGGEILVQAAAAANDDGTVRLSVSVQDPGIGMDEATRQAVFEPFVQADSSVTRKYGGTGLGLSICKQLIELMQGEISVISSPGQGSTFSFQVPLQPGTMPESPTAADDRQPGGIDRPLRILIAEDQPINQRFVAEILRKQGHTPLLADDGQQAVQIWKDQPVDLVLMDIQMPVLDGIKAMAAIRAAEDTIRRHTPIIALTAHAIVGDRERLLAAGFDGYQAKPLQVAGLFTEMARVMEQISKESHT